MVEVRMHTITFPETSLPGVFPDPQPPFPRICEGAPLGMPLLETSAKHSLVGNSPRLGLVPKRNYPVLLGVRN